MRLEKDKESQTHYTVLLQMKNSTRSTSAIGPVTMEIAICMHALTINCEVASVPVLQMKKHLCKQSNHTTENKGTEVMPQVTTKREWRKK